MIYLTIESRTDWLSTAREVLETLTMQASSEDI